MTPAEHEPDIHDAPTQPDLQAVDPCDVELTKEELVTTAMTLTPLSAADIHAFLACTDEERRALVESYRVSGVMPSESSWAQFVLVLKLCAETASLVIPIVGCIAGVYGLANLVKGK